MKKLTKIIATIGPVTDTPEKIQELIEKGVNIFRFNLKHSDLVWHSERIKRVQSVSKKMGIAVGTLIDLQGPEIRITIPQETFLLEKGETVIIEENPTGEIKSFSISHPNILQYLEKGQHIIVDDGKFEFEISKVEKNKIHLLSKSEGTFKTRKTLNIPGVYFPVPVLTDRDKEAIKMAKKDSVDFIALSFVRKAQDINDLKKIMKDHNVTAKVISKVETKMAIDNLDEIIEASDAIMVARGDLGIELPLVQVPYYQKIMIKKCIEVGKPVITATQMLESMVENPFATRAEISDIANAVYDFTDAIMLSGETAYGKYSEKAVETMRDTASFTEQKSLTDTRTLFHFAPLDQEDMVCNSAYSLLLQFLKREENVVGFIVFTQGGSTARKLSRFRPKVPIYAFSPTEEVLKSLTISFGVRPILQEKLQKKTEVVKDDIKDAIHHLSKHTPIKKGDKFIVLHGDYWADTAGTSTVRIVTI